MYQDSISSHVVNFYHNVYNTDNVDTTQINHFTDNCNQTTVPDSLSDSLDDQIQFSEIEPVVKNLSDNKSLVWDSLT